MAGMGRKVWTRETVSSTEVQGYLQDQVVMRFASAAARDTAVPAPTEGMVCTLDATDEVLRHNGTRWVRIAGPTSVLANNESIAAGSSASPGGVAIQVTGLLALPAHTPGKLRVTGHVVLAGSNICAGYLSTAVGPGSGSLVGLAPRSRYHNNGNVATWTVPVEADYDSDGTAKQAGILAWSDPNSSGTVTSLAASLRVYAY